MLTDARMARDFVAIGRGYGLQQQLTCQSTSSVKTVSYKTDWRSTYAIRQARRGFETTLPDQRNSSVYRNAFRLIEPGTSIFDAADLPRTGHGNKWIGIKNAAVSRGVFIEAGGRWLESTPDGF
jgi:hypothetical protein